MKIAVLARRIRELANSTGADEIKWPPLVRATKNMTDRLTIDAHLKGHRTDPLPSSSETGSLWTALRVETVEVARKPKIKVSPENKEPEIVWVLSGETVVEERVLGGQWLQTTTRAGDFYLTAPGPAYEVKSKPQGVQPVRLLRVTLSTSLMTEALAELFGRDANRVHLRDVSGFKDPFMSALMEKLQAELASERGACRLLVRAIAETLAIHIAQNYSVVSDSTVTSRSGWGLPGFKLRKIADFMLSNLGAGFSLTRLAAEADMSEFHFSRMFKRTTGKSPSQYFIGLKMEKAQALLRETRKDVIEIAFEVGYSNPSHFAQVFRRETGRSPSEYRRQL
jgi:AraC family transcriptional regulator